MKTIHIPNGEHRPKGLFLPKLYMGKADLTHSFRFSNESDYYFGDADDYDINKLFGFSWNGFHHTNSARVGWNLKGIWLYAYVDKKRIYKKLDEYEKGRTYHTGLFAVDEFLVVKNYQELIEFGNEFKWGYQLGHFFGGNRSSPGISYEFV